MKHVIIIPDGAADLPLDELGGRTPFQAAHQPHTDALAREAELGVARTTPPGMPCGSDVCSMSLLGYDPLTYHTGRAPLEAAALGLNLKPTDWVFRVNFVSVDRDGLMQDHSAGHISDEQAKELLRGVLAQPDLIPPAMSLHEGVSYRNIMVDHAADPESGHRPRDWSNLISTPPHDIPAQPIEDHLPHGAEHDVQLQQVVRRSADYLREHPVNRARIARGQAPATHLWPWGQGQPPSMPSFESRFGLRGSMITAVDLLAGIASFIGWDRLDVPNQSSYHDTDYQAAGRWAVDALSRYDVVCVHIEAPDESSHAADAATKVASLEAIDRYIVAPIAEALRRLGEHRLLLLPDHYTLVSNRKHHAEPVPFLIAGTGVAANGEREGFSEAHAQATGLSLPGHELIPRLRAASPA